MMSTKTEKKLFYSWQSDSDERVNKILQRDILKAAMKAVRKSEPELAIRLESDTTGSSGTPEIVNTIFGRIEKSFCVASDISIINPGDSGRKTPNPNVLLELGYAARVLGWDRIITFFNSHYGDVKELPFDLKGRKPTVIYNLNPNASNEEVEKTVKNLSQWMQSQIKLILNLKELVMSPSTETKNAKLRRQRDVKNLKAVLSYVSTMAIERHVALFQESEVIHYDIFNYAIHLEAFDTSSRFHLYDSKLRELISNLSQALHKTLNYGQFFSYHDGNLYKFIHGDWYQNDEDEKAAIRLHGEMVELNEVLRVFVKYVSENYLEVDVVKLNRIAVRDSEAEDRKIENRIKSKKK